MKKTSNHFVIFSQPRSGNNLMRTTLAQHPQIKCYGEILHPNHICYNKDNLGFDVCIQEILDWFGRCQKQKTGFVLQDYQMSPYVLSRLHDLQPSIIHLLRKNRLERYVSWEIAKKSLIYLSCVPVHNQHTVRINIPKLLEEFQNTRHECVLHDFRTLTVYYEELSHNLQDTVSNIFSFLGLKSCLVLPRLVKIEQRPIHQIIENWDEVKKALQHTPWQSHLDQYECFPDESIANLPQFLPQHQ